MPKCTLNIFKKTLFNGYVVKCACFFLTPEAAKSALDRSSMKDCPYAIYNLGGTVIEERGLK